jgi:acetyl esterase/lipase
MIFFYSPFIFPAVAQEIPEDVKIFKDISYAKINKINPNFNSLDIYAPLTCKNLPVIVFIHGGTWVLGNKGILNDKITSFLSENLIYVSINYRLSPDVQHPSHAEDVASAIVWLYKNIADYGGNPQKIFLLGHSAGGHLSALIALDKQYLNNLGFSNKIISGIIGLDSAAYHLPTLFQSEPENSFLFEMAFGKQTDIWEEASPINYAEKIKSAPPFLLIYAGDRKVSEKVNKAFYASLKKYNHTAEIYFASDKGHVSIESDLGKNDDIVFQVILKFIKKHLTS